MDLNPLKKILPNSGLVVQEEQLKALAVDGLTPQAAAYPETVEQAAAVVGLANDKGWGTIIRGAGTKLSQGNIPTKADLVLCLERLNRIIDIDPANLTVTVQAGVLLSDLQDLVGGFENRCFFPLDGDVREKADELCSSREHKGAFVPLDPPFSAKATIGGILASGSVGPSRLGWGLPRDIVLGTRFIRADGKIIGMGGKTVKNVSGYDVGKLMIGSLGSLGVICEATLRLLPLPEKRGGMLLAFENLDKALGCCAGVLESKLLPASLELMNRAGTGLGSEEKPDGPENGWWISLGLEGTEAAFDRQVKDIQALARGNGAVTVTVQDETQARDWRLGRSEPGSQVSLSAYFPLSTYSEIARAWSGTAGSPGLNCALVLQPGCGTASAHLAQGSPNSQADLVESFRQAATKVGGGLVVQTAPAGLKQSLDLWGPLPSGFKMMQSLKNYLDPKNILNPGRFLGGL